MENLNRLRSIDIFRAVTMLLMVFVNDVDGVKNIPEWIKHAKADEDALGFADTIFPAFLFIVGLSIPLAIGNRLQKRGTSTVFRYILSRSLSLLVMGVIHVNLEHYSNTALLARPLWEILATLSFFLIWLDYSRTSISKARYLLQGLGWVILLILCVLFKGEDDGQIVWMRTYWWGILGLIGWAYLICSTIFAISKGNLSVSIVAAIFFFLFDLAAHAGWLNDLSTIKHYFWIVGDGSMPAFTMCGVVFSSWYLNSISKQSNKWFWLIAPFSAFLLVGIGCIVRPFGGISKIHATPAWVAICTGISIVAFVFFAWLIDVKQKQNWFKIILPAGTSTLTCYLIPYFLYSFFELLHFRYPAFLNEGWGGLLRSVLIAFLVVLLTGWLQRKRICIKA